MKYFISIILLIFTLCSFAMDKKLIYADVTYEKVEKAIPILQGKVYTIEKSIDYWSKELENENKSLYPSEESKKFYRQKIDEHKTQLQSTNIQITETQNLLKKLEPLKQEYDTQVKKEHDREEFISSALYGLGTVGLPLAIIVLFGVFIFKINRKYKKMLEEGKISQQEYKKLTGCNTDSLRRHRINPATGLPIVGNGTCDVGGNVRGSSSSRIYDYGRDYRERHRWDHHDDLQRRNRH